MSQNPVIGKYVLIGYSSVLFAKFALRALKGDNNFFANASKSLQSTLDHLIDIHKNNEDQYLIHDPSFHLQNVYSMLSKIRNYIPTLPAYVDSGKSQISEPSLEYNAFNTHENCGIENSIEPIYSSITFNDIKGFDDAKKDLDVYISQLKMKTTSIVNQRNHTKACIIFGPPIPGRNLLAHGLAGETKTGIFEVSEISVSGYIYCNEKWISSALELIASIKKCSPCILFFENLDCYCKNNPKVLRSILNEIDKSKDQKRIIVLAAASKLHSLSECIIESNKFDNIVQLVILNYNKRKELFLYYLTNIQFDLTLDVDLLIKATEGMTSKQIKRVVNCSARKAELQNRCRVTMQDICYALLTMNPTCSKTASLALTIKSSSCSQIGNRSKVNAKVSRSNSTRTSIQAVNSFFRPNKCEKLPLYKGQIPSNINVRSV